MTWIFLDATTLIRLGSLGELELLTNFSGNLVVLPAVQPELDTEPARTNLQSFLESHDVDYGGHGYEGQIPRAMSLLEESERNGDVEIIAAVLVQREDDRRAGVVSDDRRIRTTADAFGATVTGTIGVLVRAVEEGLSESVGLDILERIDSRGLHMTGELRETAESLIHEAAEDG
jgi:predicted nucleic acid-binding protein